MLPYGYAGAPVVVLLALCPSIFVPVGDMSAGILKLTSDDNGRDVTAHPGDVIEVRLPENATTGYRWSIDDYDKDILALVGDGANYPEAAVGSGGDASFRFRVNGKGQGRLSLKYWRHWEGPASIKRHFSVAVDVH